MIGYFLGSTRLGSRRFLGTVDQTAHGVHAVRTVDVGRLRERAIPTMANIRAAATKNRWLQIGTRTYARNKQLLQPGEY